MWLIFQKKTYSDNIIIYIENKKYCNKEVPYV